MFNISLLKYFHIKQNEFESRYQCVFNITLSHLHITYMRNLKYTRSLFMHLLIWLLFQQVADIHFQKKTQNIQIGKHFT